MKSLVRYAKKLTVELDDCKKKVEKSESILLDLKQAGSDNMGNLLQMLNNYKTKEANAAEEIDKLKQLEVIKNDEISGLNVELESLRDFQNNIASQQEATIDTYKHQI